MKKSKKSVAFNIDIYEETEIFIKSLHFQESCVILSKLFKMEFVNCIRIILNYIER